MLETRGTLWVLPRRLECLRRGHPARRQGAAAQTHRAHGLGTRPTSDVRIADVRRLVDRLSGTGLAPATVTGIVGIVSGLFRYGLKGGHVEWTTPA